MMRIVIDMQGAQGSNRQRGIGRYSLSIALAVARHRGKNEIILALNGLLPDTIEPIRIAFEGLLPQENIRVWQSPGPVCHLDPGNDWRRKTGELLYEAFLASLEPDLVLVSSLFEGLGDDAITSIGSLSSAFPTAVILYDLIPLIHPHPFLDNPVIKRWYENKIGHLRRAGLLLAISESSRQEAVRHLDFPDTDVVNISTAAEPHFKPMQISAEREAEIRSRYGLNRPFVMYTGGIDYRKNMEGLIRAYALLPEALRAAHQLAVVCSIHPPDRTTLETLAAKQGLKAGELVLTGFVSEDDLIALYNLCKLFDFPSWHEGFGLPALEAMSCGRAVIASNTSSIPEVIGRTDALFDPRNDSSIAAKIAEVLSNDNFRAALERHGIEQARHFSWDASGKQAIAACEKWHEARKPAAHPVPARRPKLAYISPLPPERSGISDYSAELLPELARHYEIDVIVAQDAVADPWIKANCAIRDVKWLRAHSRHYDRILYHFGNSAFHRHMFRLLEEIPGIVVLHDFFLSGIISHLEITEYRPYAWAEALYQSHGYAAMQRRFAEADAGDVVWHYPCNFQVLQNALGVTVHAENSRRLATQWYGKDTAKDWAVIPHMRVFARDIDRAKARAALKLDDKAFVVCSFGLLGPHKLNHRLLSAWLASSLARDPDCVLVFVGENNGGAYGQQITEAIARSGLQQRIRITGWADMEVFRRYLEAADIGVQLRTLSRGETSGTVLDCMNYGLATIINANGSMADVPDEGVWKLPDLFDDKQLVEALETLRRDPLMRRHLGERARHIVLKQHDPRACADQYAAFIEKTYDDNAAGVPGLVRAATEVEPALPADSKGWLMLAEAIAFSIRPNFMPRQLFVDVSELVKRDSKSGIQRVVRSILRELLLHPPEGWRIEPVYATTQEQGYRYARRFTAGFLGCLPPKPLPPHAMPDDVIEFQAGDMFLGLDLQQHIVARQKMFYRRLRNHGVTVKFVVYDLLPALVPQFFTAGATQYHHGWLETVAESDGVICISKAVADEMASWMRDHGPQRLRPPAIRWFHLGADIKASAPTHGLPENADTVLEIIRSTPSFLMVGTLEPRKAHAQALAAFELLWAEGIAANLVIVGRRGWMVDSLISHLRHHPEAGKRLFWLEGISDECLEKIYAASTCLLCPSEGEGFGLPLIEAAQHGLPVLARDIPVFREVAGEHAFYFSGLAPQELADSIKRWLALKAEDKAPLSGGMPRLTWEQSARELLVASKLLSSILPSTERTGA